jgi:amino acid adenylation domain-containing protein
MSHPNRQQAETILTELLRDSSGMELRDLDPNASFLELGFDSLFLIQFSQKIKQKTGVKITFRQLIESVSTVDTLIGYLAAELPSNSQATITTPTALPQVTPAPVVATPASATPSTAAAPNGQTKSASPAVAVAPTSSPASVRPVGQPILPLVAAPLPQLSAVISPTNSGSLQGIEQLISQQNQLMALQLQVLQAAACGMPGVMVAPIISSATNIASPAVVPAVTPVACEIPSVCDVSAALPMEPKPIPIAATTSKEPEKKVFERFGPYKPIRKSATGGLTESQQKHLDQFIARFTTKTAKSREHAQKYRDLFADPRGVAGYRNIWKSMVYQISVSRSAGSKLWDIDGNEYIDIAMGFGLNLFGQSPDFVTQALKEQLDRGVEVGPQSPLAGEVAKLLCRFSAMERATFCNTGSEAVMAAMRIARTVTGKPICVFFNKDYHGNFDEVLLRSAVVGGKRRTSPAAPGVPQILADNTIVLDYGTEDALQEIERRADEIAAILVEPVQSADPDFQPREFMHKIREITQRHNIAMVMDEVISGFRAAPGGAQEYFGIQGDMATYGKILGGGLPIGALAGKAQYMNALDGGTWRYEDSSSPEADMTFFAGTFVRHPLAMTAAHQILKRIEQSGPELQRNLSDRTARMAETINDFFVQEGFPIRLARFTSLFRFMFPPDLEYADMLYFHLLDRGIFTRGWGDNCFLSTAHNDQDVHKIIDAVKSSCLELRAAGFFPDRDSLLPTPNHVSKPNQITLPRDEARADSERGSTEKKKSNYPLTDAQQEIWLSSLMGTMASCAYNEPFYIKFHGPLDQKLLLKSLDHVLSRHEALKLRFDSQQPLQFLDNAEPYKLEQHDWTKLSATQLEEQSQKLVTQIATTPFDLSTGPLVRLYLVQEVTDVATLYVSAHHIICDGWSWNLMLRELGETYSAWHTGSELKLPECGSFLHDFVELDQPAEQRDSLDYWRDVYRELPEPLNLPTDAVRPPAKVYDGATFTYEFDPEMVKRLKRFAGEKRVSLFSLAFTAFNLFLRRLSGQTDIVVTVPTAGQSLLENSHLVGHCVNLLPVRTQIRDDQTFSQLLSTTSSQLLDAYDHQCCTLGSIVREIRCPRDPSRMPLVEVNFNLDRDSKGVHFEDLSIDIAQTVKSAVNFEIFFNLNEHERGLRLDLDYNRYLFQPDTWKHWVTCFEQLLREIPDHSDVPVTKLNLLPPQKKEELLSLSTGERIAWHPTATVIDLIEQQVVRNPNSIAVSCNGKKFTYQEFNSLANQLARELQQLGVTSHQLVGVFMDRSEWLPVTLVAILKSGAAYVPLDPEFPSQRLQHMVDESQLASIVTVERLKNDIPQSNAKVLFIDANLNKIRSQQTDNLGTSPSATQRAYVLFTSGSTGRPKGVQIPHRALHNFLESMRKQPGIQPSDKIAAITTLSFDISILEIFLPLISGAEVVIVPNEIAKDGSALAKLLTQQQITFLQATPATWRLLIEAGWTGNKKLKGLVGGEALPVDLAQKLSRELKELWNMYGPTETTVWSTIWKVEPTSGSVSIGRPIANTTTYVLDTELNMVPQGTIGKLYIGGLGLALGYLKRPELTQEKFIPNPYNTNDHLYDTGDLVRLGIDGQLYYVTRADNQIKLRGYRIELGDIEHAMLAHKNVREAVVVVKTPLPVSPEKQNSNEHLVGYYVPREDSVSTDDLRNFLRSQLPEYMIPTWFVQLTELPLTPNLKVDRKRLPDVAFETKSQSDRIQLGPRNAIERQLMNIWKDILNIESMGIDDNFFELGGHSLLAARLMSRIEKVIGKRIPLASLLQYPTVEGLANIIRSNDYQIQWQCIVPIREGGNLLPLFCIHAAGGNILLYRELANRLNSNRPVYGVQSSALEHGLPKAKTVEEMAMEYAAEIRKLQPHGPYHLAGYCLGGTLAYEVARQLRLAGEEIGVLALFDTHAIWEQESLRDSIIRAYQRVAFHLKNAWMSGRTGISSFVAEKFREGARRMQRRWEVLSSHISYRLGWRKTEPVFLLEGLFDRASEAYIPKTLDVHLILFKPKQSYAGKVDAFFGWQNYAQDITLIELPVYPAGMLIEPFVGELAAHIERQLTLAEDGLITLRETTESKQFS